MRGRITLTVSIWLTFWSAVAVADADTEDVLERGREVYREHCAGCHGAGGDGKGFDRLLQSIRPPDFTVGDVRYKSTAPGVPPTDDDLTRSVAAGVRRSAMPHHRFLGTQERLAVVAYVKGFYPPWNLGASEIQPVELPPKPIYFGSPASVQRGRHVYDLLGCSACHGPDGQGVDPHALPLPLDTRGLPQYPIDLTDTAYKGGGRAEDVLRTLVIGLDGTAMLPYGRELLDPDGERFLEGDSWHLVGFLLALGIQTP